MIHAPNYSCYQRLPQNLTTSKTKGSAWPISQCCAAVAVSTWPTVPMYMFLAHSTNVHVLSPQQMWNTQGSLTPLVGGQPLLNLANITVHLKETVSPLAKHFFPKRLLGRDFSFFVFPTLASSPTKWWIHWWFTQGTPCWTHPLGPYRRDSATVRSVSFQGVQVKCKWCVCLVLVFWFGIMLAFCEKGKRCLCKSYRAKILLWDVAVQMASFVLVGETLLQIKEESSCSFLLVDVG